MKKKIDLKNNSITIPVMDLEIDMAFWSRLRLIFTGTATGIKGNITRIRGDCYIEKK